MCCGWILAGNGFWMWGMSKCRACRPPSVEPGPSSPWQLRYYSWEHLLGTFFEHILSIILEHLLGLIFKLILNTIWECLLYTICSKGEWLRDCPLDSGNCFLDSLVSIFNPGLKQPQKCLVSWKSDSSGGGGGCLAIIARCPSVPAKRQTTMRVDNGGIVPVHRSTLSTLWGGGEAIKGSCASRPIHLNSRERGDGSLFISTTHQR